MPLVPFVAGQDLTADALNSAFDVFRAACQQVDSSPVNNSTTYVSSTYLVLPVAASSIYIVESLIIVDTNSTADFKVKFLLPSGSTSRIAWWSSASGAAATDAVIQHDATTVGEVISGGVSAGIPMSIRPSGYVVISTAAGNLTVQFAQNTANASNTILKAGSWIQLIKVT